MPDTPSIPVFQKIALEDVRFAFHATPVVDNVSVAFSPGELVAIVGPNGCGKSTLLKLLIGALVPQAGRITLDGRTLRDLGRIALARRMALVPQMAGDAAASAIGGAGFTVLQTVLMARYAAHVEESAGSLLHAAGNLGIFGFESALDQQLATQAMWNVDVHHLIDRDVDSLSGGERQRVAIARAFTQNTPVLLLDEPTSALDLFHQLELVDHLRSLTAQGRLIVLVTHDLNLAASCASRIILMDAGKVVADGSPAQVLTPQILEPVYHVKVQTHNGLLRFHRAQQNP